MKTKPVVLMILDGYGISNHHNDNAIYKAKKPNLDKLMKENPYVLGAASGFDVGLPDGQMGNSEVGHTNIGAGRIVFQELTRISKEIKTGEFYDNKVLLGAIQNCKDNHSALHLYGLLSDGGVHSHNTHLYALLELAKKHGITKVYVHAFLDGRDTPPDSGMGYVKALEAKMAEIGVGEIATISGRYYAMDRDNRWERVKLAYDAIALGYGNKADSATACMENSYAAEIYDEFVLPTIITKDDEPTATVELTDSIIFFNFRPDRAREITRAFCDPDFTEFTRPAKIFPLYYVCFTEYDTTIPNKHVAFTAQSMSNDLGAYLADKGLTQLRLAETEKYAHVTFFFNGGREEPYVGEDRILVPSPKVDTYDQMPEMSAVEVTDKLIGAIESKKYDLIVINYANCDMVGHTGMMNAAIKAVETVDRCMGRVLDAVKANDAVMFLCADHGNADCMIDPETGGPFTAHTTNPVPFVLFNAPEYSLADGGRLADIAPTILELINQPIPPEMTGKSLLIKQ